MKRTFLFLLLVLIPNIAFAEDPVHFADLNLKSAVEEALGISNPTPTDMLALTYLDASEREITDLTGIQYATNLIELRAWNNQISDISALTGLTNLEVLLIAGNQISDLNPVSGLTKLRWLHLQSNQISDISMLDGLTQLVDLYLSNNQISNISVVSSLTNLEVLLLAENDISNPNPVSGLTNLRWLHLHGNQISDISMLAGLTQLVDLYLSNNQISNISVVSNFMYLEVLLLDNNIVNNTSVLADLTKLRWLFLEGNQISDISSLSDMTNLHILRLARNPLDAAAYSVYIPLIISNNPNLVELTYDPNPWLSSRPQSRHALILAPFHWDGYVEHSEDLIQELRDAGYPNPVYLANRRAYVNDQVNIPRLKELLEYGDYGIIHFTTHGERTCLGIESFRTAPEADNRINELVRDFNIARGDLGKLPFRSSTQKTNIWSVCIKGSFVERYARNLPNSFIYFESCWMGVNDGMKNAFLGAGAGGYLGFDNEVALHSVVITKTVGEATNDFYDKAIDKNKPVATAALETDGPCTGPCPLCWCGRANFKYYGNQNLRLVQPGFQMGGLATQGGTTSGSVLIDNSVYQVVFNVIWSGSDLDLSLMAPDGSLVDKNTSGIMFKETDTSESIRIPYPMPGEWTIMIYGVAVPPEGEEYASYVDLSTELVLIVSSDKEIYDSNEPISLTAKLLYDANSYSNAIVIAEIKKPDTNETIILYDDGLHNDGNSGDGIYANTYSNTSIEGDYEIIATASGRNPFAEPFVRQTSRTVLVQNLPDLVPIDLTTTDDPVQGQISLTATILNTGSAHANDILVEFYDVTDTNVIRIDPNRVIDYLEPNQARQVSVIWDANFGTHQLFVVVDPNDTILEKDEANNFTGELLSIGCIFRADFNNDWFVTLGDLAEFVDYWLEPCPPDEWCQGRDIDKSGHVDFADFAILSTEFALDHCPP